MDAETERIIRWRYAPLGAKKEVLEERLGRPPGIVVITKQSKSVGGNISTGSNGYFCDSGKCIQFTSESPKNSIVYLSSDCNGVCKHSFGCNNGSCEVVDPSSVFPHYSGDPRCEGQCKSNTGYACNTGDCEPINVTNPPIRSSTIYWENTCGGICGKHSGVVQPKKISGGAPARANWSEDFKRSITDTYYGVPLWSYILLGFILVFLILFFITRREE